MDDTTAGSEAWYRSGRNITSKCARWVTANRTYATPPSRKLSAAPSSAASRW